MELTECVKKHFSKYSGLWSFPKSATPQVLDGASQGHIIHRQTITRRLFSAARYVRSRLCPPELSDLTELVKAADDKLFQLTVDDNHILSSLLPLKSDNRYNLRKKHHNIELPVLSKNTHLHI